MRIKAILLSTLACLFLCPSLQNQAQGQSPTVVLARPTSASPRVIVSAPSTQPHGTTTSGRVVSTVPPTSTYTCPKCGRVHAHNATVTASPVVTSYRPPMSNAPMSTTAITPNGYPVTTTGYSTAPSTAPTATASSGGTQNVLSMLNAQRSRQGLRSLRYDPVLQSVAERRVRLMASTGRKGHPPGSFAPGRYEGVGWSSSYSPRGVSACYTSNPNMTAAGAAMARGRDGVYFAVVYR